MDNPPSDQPPASSPHEGGDVTVEKTVFPDGHWREITKDSLGRMVREVVSWGAERDKEKCPGFEQTEDEDEDEGEENETAGTDKPS